jgi:penicillin G amidase
MHAALRWGWRGLKWLLVAVVAIVLLLLLWLGVVLGVSKPKLEGEVAASELSAPVTVARDADGNPVITGATRADVAYALGYLHGQERFFQMDTLRRVAAGELGAMFGEAAAKIDRAHRVHRFRARARQIVATMAPAERALLDRYVAGVNRGLGELGASPFEYSLLFAEAEPWRPEDTVLAVYAMYLNLQPEVPELELDRAHAEQRGGRALADLLYPQGTELDAPLDGSRLAETPLPERLPPMRVLPRELETAALAGYTPVLGSNNWAVAGPLSTSGAALVANDMHLGLPVPSTWYRAQLIVRPAPGSTERPLSIAGVTLPGTPTMTAGSNGRIAWGFTNSYIDTSDAVIVEPVPGRPGFYRTPEGPRPIRRVRERMCVGGDCEDMVVEETIWGPIVGKDAFGRTIAMRWTAHDRQSIQLGATAAMEQAGSVAEALAIAHRAGIPHQNLVVGDRAGNIAWTIMSPVPARYGFDGRDAVSFADGTRGWRGYLPAAEVPRVINPAQGRIWTANSRVVGGADYAKLGDGRYDTGLRAGRIRDLLFAKQRFGPRDFLSIQLDDRNARNDFWQPVLLAELEKRRGDPRFAAMIGPVRNWGGRAVPDSVGYRLIDVFRTAVRNELHLAFLGAPEKPRRTYASNQSEGTLRRLLRERPPALVPPGHRSWDTFLASAVEEVAKAVDKSGGDVAAFRWGEVGRAGVRHPLAASIPGLGWLTDPKDVAVPGDMVTVRAQRPGMGASERFAVSPGFEREGIFHMPGGQSGHPWAPYYLAGHRAWVEGRPTPFLPGPARWTLRFVPAR